MRGGGESRHEDPSWGGGRGLHLKQTVNTHVSMATAFSGLPRRFLSRAMSGRIAPGSPHASSCCVFLFGLHGNGDLSPAPPHW